MKKSTKTILILLGIIILLGFIFNQIRINKATATFIRNGRLTNGLTFACNPRTKSGIIVDASFTYQVDQSIYKSESEVNGILFRDFKENFLNKSFPVIFLPSKPEESQILITPDQFKKFKVDFPDSLEWVNRFWMKN